jgi:hypothetical protein
MNGAHNTFAGLISGRFAFDVEQINAKHVRAANRS